MPSLSNQELEQGKTITELLSRVNPQLIPSELCSLIPEYKEYIPFRKAYGLWSTEKTFIDIMRNRFQYDKVALLVSGIAGAGKDTVREEIEQIAPDLLFKLVTGTSRKPREGEVDGRDYYFFNNPESFQESVENNEFVEWVRQGDRFYGLPKQSLQDALAHPSPVIWSQVEMGAWPQVEKYLTTQTGMKTFVLKMFVLPYMDFSSYRDWLGQEREDADTRLTRTGWEIAEAPRRADYIVTNRFRDDRQPLTYTAQAIVKHTSLLLRFPEWLRTFPLPFKISPGIGGVEDVVRYHDKVV